MKAKRKRAFTRWIWGLLPRLPEALRQRLVRRMFSVPDELPRGITFKVAETPEEFEQAFRVLHDSYVELGFMEGRESRLRITKYHALPTTAILVVKNHDEVIATMSIVSDSGLGLPVDRLWDISALRGRHNRVAEIGSLAIKKEFRKQRGQILIPLCRFMYHFCEKVLGIDCIIAVTNPHVSYFYRDLFLFQPFDNDVPKFCGDVKGQPAIGQWLDLGTAPQRWAKVYGHRPPRFDFLSYFMPQHMENFIYPPAGEVRLTAHPRRGEIVQRFLLSESHVLADLPARERLVLANQFFGGIHGSLAAHLKTDGSSTPREDWRFELLCRGRVANHTAVGVASAYVLDVSASGVKIRIPDAVSLRPDDLLTLTVELGLGRQATVRAVVVWYDDRVRRAGLRVLKSDSAWGAFIRGLESRVNKRAA